MSEDLPRARQPHEVDYGELPELARALRALGSPRRSGGSMQQQFFAPLLDARRIAAASQDPEDAVRAFDAAELGRAFDRMMDIIVHGWPDARDSARRALRAELRERARRYRGALDTLDDRAADLFAAPDVERIDAWRAWTTQLAAVFDAADRAWMAVRSIVDALPPKP
ncbi:MAG TPA: hypothetical protein VKH19_13240 [Gemmatimonadaceae bacterium]|nr:hypothetical protein [Gemmatimonadaceae bacterium]